ncbi:MAG: tetratricopeptide repeat protein, partial [Sedimentisphaerales bacterium]|nr:tetratricopeptide repeat protein [Sedimentisphaerales bacterium]
WPLNRIKSFPDDSNTTGYPPVTVWRLILEKIPFFVLVTGSCVATVLAQSGAGAVVGTEQLPFKFRFANALISYTAYLGNMLAPLDLRAYYPWSESIPMYKPVLSFVLLAGITIAALWLLRRRRYLAVGWLWYLGMLVPVIGLMQVGTQTMADRYTYLPSIGFFIMITWGISDLLEKWRFRQVALGILAGVLIVAMIAVTRQQTTCWRDNNTLFSHALGVDQTSRDTLNPEDYALFLEKQYDEIQKKQNKTVKNDLRFVLGYYYLGELNLKLNQLDHALTCFSKAYENGPNFSYAIIQLAELYRIRGETDQAIEQWQKIITLNPNSATANYSLGLLILEKGDFDQAEKYLRTALKINENHYLAANNLAILLNAKGKTSEALALWERVLRIEPNYGPAHYNLGVVMYTQKQFDQALNHFHAALRSNPEWFEVLLRMGDIYYQQKNLHEAIDYWTKALALKPDSLEILNNLAWIFATSGDKTVRNPEIAVTYAQQACKFTQYRHYATLGTLAAAYAAAGDFDKAVETAEKSIQIATEAGNTSHVQETTARLKLYQMRQPYYQSP